MWRALRQAAVGTWRGALDLLYPARCAACDRFLGEPEREPFCDGCRGSLVPIDGPVCVRCGLPWPARLSVGPCCSRCARAEPAFATARAPYAYGGELAVAIRRFKYADRPELAGPLSAALRPLLERSGADLLVPVPLTARRLRARGYNQAALLAGAARPRGGRVSYGALVRRRDAAPTAALSLAQRAEAVRGAFTVPAGERRSVAGRRIALVDDVLTTGATADACARALLGAGAARVDVVTLARTA